MSIRCHLFTGNQATTFISNVAELRINIFREYPYLYDGSPAYEESYLHKFMATPDSTIAIIFDGESVVGALTGLPLKYEEESVIAPWKSRKESIEEIYYFSEALLYPTYRGRGLGKRLFETSEAYVESLNTYKIFSLATVIRESDHPLKPQDYASLDGFWKSRGYSIVEGVICTISWKEVHEDIESDKPLQFWSKIV